MLTVVFRIANQAYGIAAACVHEIVLRPALTMPAGADTTLSGLLNLRGHFLPVIDGGALVGGAPIQGINSHVLLLGRATPELALLVDAVLDVTAFAAEQISTLAPGSVAPFLHQIVSAADEPVLLLHVDALLQRTAALRNEDICI